MSNINNSELILRLLTSRDELKKELEIRNKFIENAILYFEQPSILLLESGDELCDWLGRLITKHKAKSNKFDELKHLLQNEQCKKTE